MSKDLDITILGSSVVVILWWVSVWVLIEEGIEFVSGNRKHLKLAVCLIIIFGIVLTCALFPQYVRHF